jgi:tetratricopeptide (TPR) repeat protein
MQHLPAYRTKLYRNFKALEANDFHGIVRYYERNEDGIRSLDTDEYFDCTLAYAEALFETGAHRQHALVCEQLLELLLNQDFEGGQAEELFREVLFKKAASHFRLGEFRQAEHVLRELVKIHPWDAMPQRFLQTCLLKQKPAWLSHTRVAAVVLSLLAATTIMAELFVIRPFFNDYYQTALYAHNGLLASGVLILAAGECRHYWLSRQYVRRLAGSMKRRKQQKPAG